MRFHKGSFYIQKYDNYTDSKNIYKFEGYVFEKVTGWIDETGEYGFHKSSPTVWKATDLKTGTAIVSYPTRKECAAFIEGKQEEIKFARTLASNVTARQRMNSFLLNFGMNI